MPTELDLLTASADAFTPLVGQLFEAVFTDGRLPLTLAEVRTLGSKRPSSQQESFALLFHGAPNLRLPQHIYRLENAVLGTANIFLVQVAAEAEASKFEAIFN